MFARNCFLLAVAVQIAFTTATYIGKQCSVVTQLDDCGLLYCKCPNANKTGEELLECVGECAVCDDRSQCILGADAGYQSCKEDASLSADDDVCTTKSLIHPFLTIDAVTGVVALLCGMFASGAGIGGGGLFVPLFVITGWGKRAVERSLAATTGLSIAMMIMIAPRRHPDVARPQIDYPAMLLLEPIVLLGTVPGKLLNKIMPTVVVYVLLLVLLLVVSIMTWLKYRKFKNKEDVKALEDSKEEEKKPEEADGTPPSQQPTQGVRWLPSIPCGASTEFQPPAPGGRKRKIKTRRSVWINATTVTKTEGMENQSGDYKSDPKSKYFGRGDGPISEELQAVYESESEVPVLTVVLLLSCWAVVLVISTVIKFVECGGVAYWLLNSLFVPTLAGFTIVGALRLHRDNQRNEELGYHYAPSDIRWTTKNLIMWPIFFIVAGVMSSLLGIGGGMVIAPLLLETGMNPVVSSSTTACMTLFTSSSAAIQFLIISQSTWDYFLYYVAITFVAGLIGRLAINAALAKTGKQSIVVAVLAALITLALVAMGYVSIRRIIDGVSAGSEVAFEQLCSKVEKAAGSSLLSSWGLTTLGPSN